MISSLAIAIPRPREESHLALLEEVAASEPQPALRDDGLLRLVAEACSGAERQEDLVREIQGFIGQCDLDSLRRALVAMEFSFEIVELEMANPGI